jgi:hypothetical protein
MKPSEVPIPKQMQHLPIDERGYPIFYVAFMDHEGKPQFVINDQFKRDQCLKKDLCEICGKRLFRGRWFVGGPMSAFHPDGVYNDAPMHLECKDYAMKVCPWLAAPRYSRSMAEDKAKHVKDVVLVDETMLPGRPAVFVAVMAVGQTLTKPNRMTGTPYIRPKKPFRFIEYWQHGKKLSDEEGRASVLEFLQSDESYREVRLPRIVPNG